MSLGYANKLSYIEDVGKVGMQEIFDPPAVLQQKIAQLAMMIKKSKHLVVFTGAGISTSSGIPDFRGPKGIWTLQREGKSMPEASLPFNRAMPSMTHMALVELEKAGILKFVISQNIDGLHLRSGIPREKVSELHGNSFMEMCPSCGVEYFRDFEVESVGLKETSRRCSNAVCGGKLKDTVLDWEDELPLKEMSPAEKHCKMSDVVLCLGSSLQIIPACNLPLECLRAGGKVVIVNLQETPKDKIASMVIRERVDKIIAGVMELLNMRIPPFVRIDLFQTIITQSLSSDGKCVNWTLRIASVHGNQASLPFIKSVGISFSEGQKMKEALLDEHPLRLKRRSALNAKPFDILLELNFAEGCGCSCSKIKIPVDFKVQANSVKHDMDSIFQKLRDEALQDPCCGQNDIIERRVEMDPKTEAMVHAMVTNISVYDKSAYQEAAPSRNGTAKRRNDGGHRNETPRKRSEGHKRKAI